MKIYSSEKVSDRYLQINSCGEQTLSGHDYRTVRSNGRKDYAIQYISSGLGFCNDGKKTTPVEPGSLILYFPDVVQDYSFKKENNTTLMWTHFTGTACSMLDRIKTDKAIVVKITDTKEFEHIFRRMINTHYLKEPYNETICEGYLNVLITMILKSACYSEGKNINLNHEGLQQVLSSMNRHFNEPILLQKYAKMCFVSQNRFIHMFKEYTGVSPYHYQLKIRIDRAVEMLSNTAISVSDCAEAVGFKDCSYFCRVFKKFTGKTPMYYKK